MATFYRYSTGYIPFQQRNIFRIADLVWSTWSGLLGLAPTYLQDLCCPTPGSEVAAPSA